MAEEFTSSDLSGFLRKPAIQLLAESFCGKKGPKDECRGKLKRNLTRGEIMKFDSHCMMLPLILLVQFLMGSSPADAQRLKSVKPWIGVAIEGHNKGVLIKRVYTDTPAMKAGLKAGDIVWKVGKSPVTSPKAMIEAVTAKGVGHKIDVYFHRENKKSKLSMVLEAQPDLDVLMRKRLIGRPAIDFELKDLKGHGVPLAKLKGKVTLINFWATWCPACKSALPTVEKFAKANQGKGLEVLAISDEPKSTLTSFFSTSNPTFKVLQDLEGKVSEEYVVPALPTFILIGKDGNVIDAVVGAGGVLEELLKKATTQLKK